MTPPAPHPYPVGGHGEGQQSGEAHAPGQTVPMGGHHQQQRQADEQQSTGGQHSRAQGAATGFQTVAITGQNAPGLILLDQPLGQPLLHLPAQSVFTYHVVPNPFGAGFLSMLARWVRAALRSPL